MIRLLILLCALLCAPGAVAADPDQAVLASVLARLADSPFVRADFQQDKTLPALKRVLHSEGRFLFQRQKGVLWRLQKPVTAELVVTAERLVQKTARTQSRLELGSSPYGAAVNLLLTLLAGDSRVLQENFSVVSVRDDGTRWILQLRPEGAALQKLFTSLQLSGDRYVRTLSMQEAGGGSTRIRFLNPASGPTLTAEENALFALAD